MISSHEMFKQVILPAVNYNRFPKLQPHLRVYPLEFTVSSKEIATASFSN